LKPIVEPNSVKADPKVVKADSKNKTVKKHIVEANAVKAEPKVEPKYTLAILKKKDNTRIKRDM
jgi:hypothetical protein